MKQLLEKYDKKKCSKKGKKKPTLTSSETSKEEEDLDRLEDASKQNDRSDDGENSDHKMDEFEKCLEAMENRGSFKKQIMIGHILQSGCSWIPSKVQGRLTTLFLWQWISRLAFFKTFEPK